MITGNNYTMALESFLYLLILVLVCALYASVVATIYDGVKRRRKWREEKEDALSVSTPWPTMNETTSNVKSAPWRSHLDHALTEMSSYDEVLRVHPSEESPDGHH